MRARVVLIMEVDVRKTAVASESVQLKLDAFREAVLPTENYGITLYRATRKDLEEMAEAGALLPNPGVLCTTNNGKKTVAEGDQE